MEPIQLSPDQENRLLEGIRVAERMQQQLDDLEACGQSCQERRQRLALARTKMQETLNRFGRRP